MISSDLYQDGICGSVGWGCDLPVDFCLGGPFCDERGDASPCGRVHPSFCGSVFPDDVVPSHLEGIVGPLLVSWMTTTSGLRSDSAFSSSTFLDRTPSAFHCSTSVLSGCCCCGLVVRRVRVREWAAAGEGAASWGRCGGPPAGTAWEAGDQVKDLPHSIGRSLFVDDFAIWCFEHFETCVPINLCLRQSHPITFIPFSYTLEIQL